MTQQSGIAKMELAPCPLPLAPITALAMSADATRVAWADEDGNAGVAEAG